MSQTIMMPATATCDAAPRRRVVQRFSSPGVPRRLTVACSAIVATMSIALLTGASDQSQPPLELELQTIEPTTFRVTTEQNGVVEPFRSTEVISDCYWKTPILSIVPEGTWVQKGDVVCELDSAEIEDYARKREITLIKYRARLDNSLHDQRLLKPDNERRLAAARFKLQSAESELQEYRQGTFPQQIEEMEKNMAMYAEQAHFAQDKLDRTESLWVLGMASRRAMEQSSLALMEREQKYDVLESKYRLLNEFTHPRSTLQLEFGRNDAERDVLRTQIRNSLAETSATLTTLSYERTLRIYERYYKRAIDSIKACTLRAPCDGQVVYGNSWYLKSRGITRIEEGKTVRYRQKVFEIPEQNHLKVSVPLHESLIYRVQLGLPVDVRLTGYEDNVIRGAISRISRYPRSRSSYTPGVKDYWLDVELRPTAEQQHLLRPKMDAAVRMSLTELPESITVPRDAVVGCAGENFVWLYGGNELRARKVELGEANDRVVCVASGVAAGDRIAVNMTLQHKHTLTERLLEELQ